jgi:two-component system chemotaxis response regulator CheB
MVNVLVVDDSAFDRKLISHRLEREPDICVVGAAKDPYEARDKIAELQPDVIVLDIIMPRMDGLTFLNKLMKHFPIPVVVVSTVTPANSSIAFSSLQLGAVDAIRKANADYSFREMSGDLVNAVFAASKANLKPLYQKEKNETQKNGRDNLIIRAGAKNKFITIGSSTGGTRAIELILKQMPVNTPGMVVVQHMPEVFTKSFADRLNTVCRMEVKEAEEKDLIKRGKVLIAPGDHHLRVEKAKKGFQVRINRDPKVNYHRPSVDVLFESAAKNAGDQAIGVLLTGMGSDGARGMLQMKRAGSYTIAQDEETSVVYGMPKEAKNMGAAVHILPLQKISSGIFQYLERKPDQKHKKISNYG